MPPFGVCYHVVSDRAPRHLKHYAPLSVGSFEADVMYLRRTLEVVDYPQLVRERSGGAPGRGGSVVLTFDDGFSECATVARPTLLRLGASATVFVITDLIDNRVIFRETRASLCIDAVLRMPVEQVEAAMAELDLDRWRPHGGSRPQGFGFEAANFGCTPEPRLVPLLHWLLAVRPEQMDLLEAVSERLGVDAEAYLRRVRPYLTTEQIRELHSDGFTIGAHTCSHRRLQDLPPADAEREIVESCGIIRDLTGQESVPFAFPYSGWGIDRSWLAGIRARNPFIGLFFDTGGLRGDAPFVVQRVFGERAQGSGSMNAILRRAWASQVI